MIAVIDYKAGNLTSVVKALRYLGAGDVVVTQSPEEVLRADKIVLPGVGHFQSTQLLQDLGLTEAVRESVAKGTPFLGICVGLQWLYEGSTEAPETAGLGAFRGRCASASLLCYEGAELKSPHVGWNSLEEMRAGFAAAEGSEAGELCVLHALVARAGVGRYGGEYDVWRGVYGGGGARECDGRAVPSGEVGGDGVAGVEELSGGHFVTRIPLRGPSRWSAQNLMATYGSTARSRRQHEVPK